MVRTSKITRMNGAEDEDLCVTMQDIDDAQAQEECGVQNSGTALRSSEYTVVAVGFLDLIVGCQSRVRCIHQNDRDRGCAGEGVLRST